jgi:ParB family transcriptional regulator, chromosome partitioning protein
MQDSSAFQFLAIDIIHESTTNPRRTFDETKLNELAESIKHNGLIQPITVRPNNEGFEIVAGARRFRAAQIAELFSIPARIVEIDDAQALEWQLVENSQRVDVHPYEEGQGFQRLLDIPGYDVAALVEKSGKSASHRLDVAEGLLSAASPDNRLREPHGQADRPRYPVPASPACR